MNLPTRKGGQRARKTARYHCRHTFAWDAHWSKAVPVLIEATEQAAVVTVNGERFEVVEVAS